MLYGLFVIFVSYLISQFAINKYFPASRKNHRHRWILKRLFFYHLFLSFVYYLYALFNPSDSHGYYDKVSLNFRGPSWSDFYGVSTTFIEWTGYPFIHYLGFTYEAMMALFSFFGFLGFIYFYKFFSEQIKFRHKLFGYDILLIFFMLPNLHFWSGSFGKGSFIFLGLGMLFYALGDIKNRKLILLLGGLITYHIRPHIMFAILASAAIGFAFSSKINMATRIAMVLVSLAGFFFIYQDVLALVGIEQGEELTQGFDLTHRATELSKATSGIDITSYSLPFQVFTFLFRPLFFDAPGILGVIVSFENVFLLFISLMFLFKGGIIFLLRGDFLVKTAFISFVTVSIALAQISGNLGIAIRQKSQIMMLFLFVIIMLLDNKKLKQYKQRYSAWKRRQIIIEQRKTVWP